MNVCPNCGTAAPAFAVQPKGHNYLVPAILITLCCCVPAGFVAIIYAAQVNSKLAAGDIAGAQAAARRARIWSWAGFGGGILLWILYAFFFAGALTNHH
ncbi:MAG TPA: CD225/dispanin family protein [Thermoanaerobaculia bacterium]|nr:CD225/dispanin family protein [Thermoanaerobaculia bacterium]